KRVFLVILFTSFSGSLVSRISGAVQTVAEKILLRCTWLDPAEKEARRLHLQGMTVPDYTVKVRKWFCVMCDEDYEGEKCCPRCGTGVYSRAWGRQEVPSEDARADNPLQRL
uniref:zinc-ribbon domain-containing protein n=3 Tax=Escherichia coli TaxID=562 RepID=UPI00207CCCCE